MLDRTLPKKLPNIYHIEPEKHPFQINGYRGQHGSYEHIKIENVGSVFRFDMPGVPDDVSQLFRVPKHWKMAFTGQAPKIETFPFDNAVREYSGVVQLTKEPAPMGIQLVPTKYGCFLLVCPDPKAFLCLRPVLQRYHEYPSIVPYNLYDGDFHCDHLGAAAIGSRRICFSCGFFENIPNSEQAEVSSDEPKHEAEGTVEESNVDAVKIEGSDKTEQVEGSLGKTIKKSEGELLGCNCEGSTECEDGPSQKSVSKAEEGSGKATSSTTNFPNLDDEAWMIACIKRDILKINAPDTKEESPSVEASPAEQTSHTLPAIQIATMIACIARDVLKIKLPDAQEKSAHVEASPAEQTRHEVPEILIGSVEECSIHPPGCECQQHDSDYACVKIWSTDEDVIGKINRLSVKGAGVCEKRVKVDKRGQQWVYVRVDLPGLAPDLFVTQTRDRCLLFYGKHVPQEDMVLGQRNYLFFVKLKCSCCKFDQLTKEFGDDGVFGMCCKIIPGAAP